MVEQNPKQLLEQTASETAPNPKQNSSRPRSRPTNPTNSPNVRLSRSADAREEPRQTDDGFDPTAPGRWLVAIRHEPISGTVTVLSYANHVNNFLRKRPWAVFVRDTGWTFPARYLEHVEKLLDAAEIDLFDVDGIPTPKRRRELADADHDDTVVAEIRAKREWCEKHPNEIEHARQKARREFADVAAKLKPTDPEQDAS